MESAILVYFLLEKHKLPVQKLWLIRKIYDLKPLIVVNLAVSFLAIRAGRLKKIVSAWVGLDAVFRADSEYHI